MNRGTASKQGMTLIEVLLAVVILSIGVTALMTALEKCLAVVGTARDRETARGLIPRVDVEYPIEKADLDELSDSGEFEDMPGFQWFRDIEMVDEEERPGLFQVTTRIEWRRRGRPVSEEITVYKYAPKAESVTARSR